MKNLPKGFIDITGAYLVKAKPVHRVLLTPEEVNDYRHELLCRLDAEPELRKELDKLKRKCQHSSSSTGL